VHARVRDCRLGLPRDHHRALRFFRRFRAVLDVKSVRIGDDLTTVGVQLVVLAALEDGRVDVDLPLDDDGKLADLVAWRNAM